jgi:hypothetical protein
MRKAIVLLMVLAVTATTLFAGPVSAFGSVNVPSTEITLAGIPAQTNDFDDLFAGIQAPRLTDVEASKIEGEGFWGGVLGGVVGGIAGALGLGYSFNFIQSNAINNTPIAIQISTIAGSVLGGLAGAAAGAYYGFTYLPF